MQDNQQHINYTFEDIEKYFQGKMSAVDMHEMEKAALQDAFLADAIEGYKNSSLQQSQQDLEEIKNKILHKKEETKIVPLTSSKKWIWAVASAVGIILMGSLFWLNNKNPETKNNVVATASQQQNTDSIPAISQQPAIDSSTKIAANIPEKRKIVQQKNAVVTNNNQPSVINNNEAFTAINKPSFDTVKQLNETIVANEKTALPGAATVPVPENKIAMQQALQGKVAGVVTGRNAGNELIKIRGNKSTENAKQPLVVINGIPSSQNLSNINSKDIQSVQVLKDSFAPSLYGSKAANGAILITTKSNKDISGRVVDAKGNPVAGASVMIPGNKNGTQTNNEGYFSLTSNDSILHSTIAAVGYNSANQKLYKNKPNNIVLNENVANLDEVVVIGYGSTKKKSITGSVAVVRNDQPQDLTPEGGWDNLKKYVTGELKNERELDSTNIHGTYTFKCEIDENNRARKIKVLSSPDKKINPYFIKALQNGPKWQVPQKASKKYKSSIQL